jgi:BMFP domain-containing protein YqiC
VKREEFEAMAELARRAREQSEALETRVAALEIASKTSEE